MSDPSPPAGTDNTQQFARRKKSRSRTTDSLAAGTTLGHYVIKRYIGGGGMGRVYLATDEALDRDVAIKVLPQQRITDDGMVARFMNEARSAARLNHEHIAQVYFADGGETSGIPFIAFEYVEGVNVRTMVEEHDVFPLAQALNYLLQIAHALVHASAHGVVHRDVKPSNILITREGRAKLIDMGLARLLDTAEGRGDLTASGVTLGTFDYISPEQARDPRNADIRSDIYSLGCTFFFMLAGRPPFPEGTVLQKLLQHQGDAPPDIRSFQPAIPAEISFLIQKMMSKDPRQRFQTPTLLVEALTDVAERLGLRQEGQGKLVWTPVRTSRASVFLHHLPWIAAVSLLFFGFLLATIFSDPFFNALRLPDRPDGAVSTTQDEETTPAEPERSPLTVAYISLPASQSTTPHSRRIPGGSLRPSGARSSSLAHSGDTFRVSVADLPPVVRDATTPQRGVVSGVTRVVDPTGFAPGSFPTIASALVGAADGTTIELRWNDARRIAEPIRLDQRELRFVAGDNFYPIMYFLPAEGQTARSFFTVLSSELTFEGVGIEFRHNSDVRAPHWSLFELAGNTRLTFNQCLLTVRNLSLTDDTAYHENVVFFRNGIPAGRAEETSHIIEDPFAEPLAITIESSMLRGEAVGILSDVPQDIYLSSTDSIIALAKPFLQVVERHRVTRRATIEVDWDRVAFFGTQGVALLLKDMAAAQIIVDFKSQNSIFVLHRSPFASFRGASSHDVGEEFRLPVWRNNYFHGVTGLDFRAPPTSYDILLDEWLRMLRPEVSAETDIDTLPLRAINKPMSRYVPRDMDLLSAIGRISLPALDWFPNRWIDQ